MRVRGFTLIELLVVVGITAILIGLIIGVASAVRRHAKASYCASNLRQLGQAMQMYASEFQGVVLRAPGVLKADSMGGSSQPSNSYMSWAEGFQRYLDPIAYREKGSLSEFKMTKCPSHSRQNIETNYSVNAIRNTSSYEHPGFSVWKMCKLSRIVTPSGVPYLVDSADTIAGQGPAFISDINDDISFWVGSHIVSGEDSLPKGRYATAARDRHGRGRINALYFDGHVALMSTDNIRLKEWDDGIR